MAILAPDGLPTWLCVVQITDAVWMSMLLSAFAGVLAVTVVVATFYFIRYCLVFASAAGT